MSSGIFPCAALGEKYVERHFTRFLGHFWLKGTPIAEPQCSSRNYGYEMGIVLIRASDCFHIELVQTRTYFVTTPLPDLETTGATCHSEYLKAARFRAARDKENIMNTLKPILRASTLAVAIALSAAGLSAYAQAPIVPPGPAAHAAHGAGGIEGAILRATRQTEPQRCASGTARRHRRQRQVTGQGRSSGLAGDHRRNEGRVGQGAAEPSAARAIAGQPQAPARGYSPSVRDHCWRFTTRSTRRSSRP